MYAGDELLRVRPDDPEYRRQAQAEADYWSKTPGGFADAADSAGDDDLVQGHYNRRFTGDPGIRWFETLHRYGDFRRGLALGASGMMREARILETNPLLHLTIADISPGTLARRDLQLGPCFPGRVSTMVADFNFIELPESTYDLIVSSSALHHVINLEHVAQQVQRALTPDGYFFLNDYVGETARRFAPEKKLVFELLYNRELTRQGRPPSTLVWSNGDDRSSPFCGIRSADILGVFREHLTEIEVRTAGALWYPLLFAQDARPPAPVHIPLRWRVRRLRVVDRAFRVLNRRPKAPRDSFFDPRYVQQLLDVGDRLTDAGALLPTNAFAIYRKRAVAAS